MTQLAEKRVEPIPSTLRDEDAPRPLPHRLGGYSVLEYLGRGGMADLYRARSEDGRLVVIKEVRPELARRARYVELLAAEARLTGMLDHPNVIDVIGHGRRESGLPFIALEHVDGIDLRTLLRECTKRRIALPIKLTLSVMADVLRGLDHAHCATDDEGEPLAVVHRDVSPSNVLLGFDGRVRLCDFGIARSSVMPALPNDCIEGKAGYMSPEHATGESMDSRSDVFAAGILLWELLNGRRMRKGKPMALLALARDAEVPPMVVRGLPEEALLHAVVRRALMKAPEDRYPNCAAMLEDLEDYIALAELDCTEEDLALFLAEGFGDEIVTQGERRARLLATPELDLTPSAPEVERPSVSGTRRIQRALAPARPEPKSLTDLIFLGALACAATLAVLSGLSALGLV